MSNMPKLRGHAPAGPPPPSMPPMTGPPPAGPGPMLQLSATIGAAMDAGFARTALLGFCARCVRREKAAGKAVEDAEVRRAVTWQDGEPTCWQDFRPDGGWTGA